MGKLDDTLNNLVSAATFPPATNEHRHDAVAQAREQIEAYFLEIVGEDEPRTRVVDTTKLTRGEFAGYMATGAMNSLRAELRAKLKGEA